MYMGAIIRPIIDQIKKFIHHRHTYTESSGSKGRV